MEFRSAVLGDILKNFNKSVCLKTKKPKTLVISRLGLSWRVRLNEGHFLLLECKIFVFINIYWIKLVSAWFATLDRLDVGFYFCMLSLYTFDLRKLPYNKLYFNLRWVQVPPTDYWLNSPEILHTTWELVAGGTYEGAVVKSHGRGSGGVVGRRGMRRR